MSVALRDRLGALAERDFRLLFTATTITTIGDRLGSLALVFAVLDFGSATDLGLVLAARQVVEAVVVLGGGVLSDRLPRNLVMVGASLIQGGAQAVTAGLVLTDAANVGSVVVLQGLYGVGAGLVFPAEIGLIPQTVSRARLQQANALQGLSSNIARVVGPAAGGALIVAGTPGGALAVDAASFFVCAALLARIRVRAPRREAVRTGFFHELREGWDEFTGRPWLWKCVLLIGIFGIAWTGSWAVLGPVVADEDLGGAGAWAVVLAAWGAGAIVGGLTALPIRPRRPLFASYVAAFGYAVPIAALAAGAPTPVIAVAAFVAGVGQSVHHALWLTVFQREVPEHAQSRVSSYGEFGSLVFNPLGMAAAGSVATAIGLDAALWLTAVISLTTVGAAAALPSVRAIRAPGSEPEPSVA
jgi:MFS family permease